jgi:hypothetical protein
MVWVLLGWGGAFPVDCMVYNEFVGKRLKIGDNAFFFY